MSTPTSDSPLHSEPAVLLPPAVSAPAPPPVQVVVRSSWFSRFFWTLSFLGILGYCGYLNLQIWTLQSLVADPVGTTTSLHLSWHQALSEGTPAKALERTTGLLVDDWKLFETGAASHHTDRALWQYRIERALASQPTRLKSLPEELRISIDRSALFPEPQGISQTESERRTLLPAWSNAGLPKQVPAWLAQLLNRMVQTPG